MGTTSSALARVFLQELAQTGVRSALLHGDDQLAEGVLTSDLDLAFACPFSQALAAVEVASTCVRLTPILLWFYDTRSATVVLARLGEGADIDSVQVDLLVDPNGLGKYGVRTAPLVDAAASGRTHLIVSPLDEAIYLQRKAALKKQSERYQQASRAIAGYPDTEVLSRADDILVGPSLLRPLDAPYRRWLGSSRRALAELRRTAYRIIVPVGVAVRVASHEEATDLAVRLRGAIPTIAISSGSRGGLWMARRRNALVLMPRGGERRNTEAAVEAILAKMACHYKAVRDQLSRLGDETLSA
jgi:hypothetical protein